LHITLTQAAYYLNTSCILSTICFDRFKILQ